ncbi:GNAT family N-acetyltransferase [Halocella sp. SP3-1]|nr:GNAT family N-acetyltransferase [Halocella sp. SP3-1]
MHMELRACNIEDLDDLRELSIRTYSETFGAMNTEANMKEYLDRAFNRDVLSEELMNGDSKFFFLYIDNKLAGYLKLNEYMAQTDINDSESIELERIYVKKEFQGSGCGSFLIEKAIDLALESRKKYIWLGVWENNAKALGFYKRNGFYQFDQHSFVMGDDEQTDYVLRKDLLFQ